MLVVAIAAPFTVICMSLTPPQSSDWFGSIIPAAIAILVFCIGRAIWRGQGKLILDTKARTYVLTRTALMHAPEVVRGSIDDFACLVFEKVRRSGKGPKYAWRGYLVWKKANAERYLVIERLGSRWAEEPRAQVAHLLHELSQLLGVPVVDHSQEK